MIIPLGLLIFTTMMIVSLNVNITDTIRDLRKKREMKKALKREILSNGYSSKVLESIENMIQKSNIRYFLPSYSIFTHLVISIITMMIMATWIGSKIDTLNNALNAVVSTMFGTLGFMVPFLALDLFSEMLKERTKKVSVEFLIVFKKFLISGEKVDIFDAFENTVKFLPQPLKSFVDIMVYERKRCRLNPIKCFDNFKEKLDNEILSLYVENLKLCYIHGTDVLALTDEYIEEIEKLNDMEDEQSVEDLLLNIGVYLLLFFNFGVIYYIANSKLKYDIFGTKWGMTTFVIDIIVALYIVIMTIKKTEKN